MPDVPADPLEKILVNGARELGIVLAPAQVTAMLRFTSELREWNERINLTGITEPMDMVRKHLLDSLSLQPYLRGTRIADVDAAGGRRRKADNWSGHHCLCGFERPEAPRLEHFRAKWTPVRVKKMRQIRI